MNCPKCGASMEQGLPCPDCGYVDGIAKPRTDIEQELLSKGYVYDEGLGMYYLLEPGNENLRPSVTWYDPVTEKYEVVYDDATDSIYAEETTPPSSENSVLPNDLVTDFEVDLSAFEDIPEPEQPSQNTSSGILGFIFGGEKDKKNGQYGDLSAESYAKRTRQNAVVTEPDKGKSWLTSERLRWIVLSGALVVIVLLFALFFQLGRNSANPDPTPTPSPSDVITDSPSPSDEITPTPFDSPTPDPTPSDDLFQTPTPFTPSPSTETSTTPSPTPTPTPTPSPTPTPTPEPSVSDIVKPTPSPTPSEEPIPEPTPDPTPEPTPDPTPEPTPVPTPDPTPEPTPSPEPSEEPTDWPPPEPTVDSFEEPTPTEDETE